ncbi:uncharacterized protein BDW47DRAFT_100836 [Aspergillus candidus]|uniref:Uncharacterized protein n=1 Tax=Aspergillus candidus TaxID=41067 RepID=A0A2I2FJH3_ASPCN|nr:hypothetical protein BDW47DRAFT_100836 [Aspergillus candidus]PLB40788.1 hypothetical protein BDW47DRAFT_100836 [Aspergillus candidus]
MVELWTTPLLVPCLPWAISHCESSGPSKSWSLGGTISSPSIRKAPYSRVEAEQIVEGPVPDSDSTLLHIRQLALGGPIVPMVHEDFYHRTTATTTKTCQSMGRCLYVHGCPDWPNRCLHHDKCESVAFN